LKSKFYSSVGNAVKKKVKKKENPFEKKKKKIRRKRFENKSLKFSFACEFVMRAF
jgi:hypothetical protein